VWGPELQNAGKGKVQLCYCIKSTRVMPKIVNNTTKYGTLGVITMHCQYTVLNRSASREFKKASCLTKSMARGPS
jgi:hypothetical protein